MLEALEQDLATDWMKLQKPEDFRTMSALPIADKQALFAWATGLAVKPPQLSSDNRPSPPIIEEIARGSMLMWLPAGARLPKTTGGVGSTRGGMRWPRRAS